MEYVYAALLLHKLKQDINEDNVKNVVKELELPLMMLELNH